jgi:hypothetical protein
MEITYKTASEKIYQYYFNESKKNEEVILYIDDQILIDVFGENGVHLFLKLFLDIPKKLLQNSQIRSANYINSIEQLSELFLMNSSLYWAYIDSSSTIQTKCINSNSHEYDKCILLLILLLIYAENTENRIFLSPEEVYIVGNEQKIRKSVVDLLKRLSAKFKDNPEYGYFEAINLFNRTDGNYKYVGYFKYHTPLTRQLFSEIQQIKNQHGILYEIKDTNRIDLLFKDILDKRFSKNKESGYIIINKVIDGSYNIVLSNSAVNKKVKMNLEDNKIIFVTPSIYIDDNNNFIKLLRIQCECELNQIILNIDGTDATLDLTKYPQYKSISIEKWPEKIEANNFKVIYKIPENIFFIPIKLNDIWNNINRNEFIASNFSHDYKPCFYLSVDNKNIIKLKKTSEETIWSKVENYDLYRTEECKTNIFITANGFKPKESQYNLSSITILDDNFYIKRYGNKWEYPYYFLPKIVISKQHDESFFYQLNEDIEIEIFQEEFDLNNIENLNSGKLKLYLKNNSNVKIDSSEKIIELSSEPQQKSNGFSINYPVSIVRHRDPLISNIEIDDFKDSFLARILYTLSNNDIKITEKFIYKIIDEVLIKSNEIDLINSYLDKMNIIRDLIALGFIIKNEEKIEIRDFAFIQTNYKPNNFRLAGSRNYYFLKEILLLAKNQEIEVNILENTNSEIQKLLLPKEIYFTFKNTNQFETFLNTKIHEKELFQFIKTIPYKEREFDELIITEENKIYTYNQIEPIYLNSLEFDDKVYSVIIEGNNKLISEKNGKSKYFHTTIKGFGEKYFKIKNYDLAIINALSKNKLPFVFTKDHKGKSTEYGYLLIFCKYPYKIPQDFFTNLVYINGKLPEKIKLKSDYIVTNFENTMLMDVILKNSYRKEEEIEFYLFKNIPVTNNIKQSIVKQLETELYYIKYD